MTTIAYQPLKPGKQQSTENTNYDGTVLIHPEFEQISGTRQGQNTVFWSNADLALIVLDDPVPLEFPPVALSDSEIKVGDALVMAGFGPGDFDRVFGSRQFGENVVARRIELETGNVVFGTSVSPGPDHKAPAQARPGDSGGAAGNNISWFTSVYPYRRWISGILRQVDSAADAGVSFPSPDAGMNGLGSDAGSNPPP